jgi:hypothetical protein
MSALCLVFTQTASPTLACSCGQRDRKWIERDFQHSDVVFVGDVVSETEVLRVTPDGYTYADTTYTFAISKAWKGVTTAQVDLFYSTLIATPTGPQQVGGICDPWKGYFSGRMIVYARYSDIGNAQPLLEPIDAGTCSGTRQTNMNEEDTWEVTTLDAILNSSLQVGMPATGGAAHDGLAILIIAGMCLAAGLAARLRRRV